MRYFILFILSCTLIFSCSTEGEKALERTQTAAKADKAQKPKPAKANGAKAKAKLAKYWAFMKKSSGLNDDQIASTKKINNKYAAEIKKLKESKKWAGAANASNRANITKNKTAELKRTLGSSYAKFIAAGKNWSKMNKKKTKAPKKKNK